MKTFVKKEDDVGKQKSTCPLCKGAWKESQIDWIVCRIFTVCGHEVWYIFYLQ